VPRIRNSTPVESSLAAPNFRLTTLTWSELSRVGLGFGGLPLGLQQRMALGSDG
jgi:hypothetical protein